MEIVKKHEVYNISDTSENGWEMTGSASKNSEGSLDINFSVSKQGESIGNAGYYGQSSSISVNFSTTESNREDFTTYVNAVIDTLINHFTEN